jgi:hypothetical protein
MVKDENGDLLADSHNLFNRWKNYSHLFNVYRVSGARQSCQYLILVLLELKLLLQS